MKITKSINRIWNITLERFFCEKYIWFEKVASWHDVRLHKDHSLELVCSIISQSLSYASECMRIDVASLKVIFKEECLSFYKKFSKDEFLMSSKDKTLVKLWFVICNHNMKGIFLSETLSNSDDHHHMYTRVQTREISTYCINETEQMHYSPRLHSYIKKTRYSKR